MIAVVVARGEQTGQVAERGFGTGGPGASAVAVGAERGAGGQAGVPELVKFGRLQKFLQKFEVQGRHVLTNLGRCAIERHMRGNPLSSIQMACSKP